MNIVDILSSLNKIGLIAFLITLGFLIYEIILLSKTKITKSAPQVPLFQEGVQSLPPTAPIKDSRWNYFTNILTSNNKLVLIVLSILLIVFGVITLIGFINRNSESTRAKSAALTTTVSQKTAPTIKNPTKFPTAFKSPTPTETVLAKQDEELSPIPTETPLIGATSPTISEVQSETQSETVETPAVSISPTVIEQLPVTSYMNNSLILFSVSALFLFFAFLF